jgi:NADH-quinone oxidoreductase subunit J
MLDTGRVVTGVWGLFMTSAVQILLLLVTALGGVGTYLMMPRGVVGNRLIGIGFATGALAVLWVIWISSFRDVGLGRGFLFCVLGSMTVIGGVMTITQTNPVSCALWFASVVIGTAGLFMLANAQFLAAAIVVVYAGAIIVMFLFVVMMAQQHGTAIYDRLAREPAFAVIAGCALLVTLASASVATYRGASPALSPVAREADVSDASYLDVAPASPQVASLGRALLIDHWLSLEIAGTILLVSMVGAILISSQSIHRGRGHSPPPLRDGQSAASSRKTPSGERV